MEMLYDSVPSMLSELIRTAFIPRTGYKFCVADFSAIEARCLAFLAGEDWRQKAFAEGKDIYCASAEKMFHEHKASDLITKMTAAPPGDYGKQIWLSFIDTIFLGDKELIDYVQMIAGISAIGEVDLEALIISYGEGSNGKSTFWNTVAGVLGDYSGSISADTLTVGCRRNVKPELAEAKGRRLLIAAELEEGMRLSTSIVKQLCSTDKISAEKKYKDPSSFTPSHTLVLYTNHLPRVGAMDSGTWKRIRDRYVSTHPLCEMCLKDGRYAKTEEVHHIKPLSEGGTHESGKGCGGNTGCDRL